MPFIHEGNRRVDGYYDNPGPQRTLGALVRVKFQEWMTEINQNIWTTNGHRTNFAYGRSPQTYRNIMFPNANRPTMSGTVAAPGATASSPRNQIAGGS